MTADLPGYDPAEGWSVTVQPPIRRWGTYYLRAHRGLMEMAPGKFVRGRRRAERVARRWAARLNARDAAHGRSYTVTAPRPAGRP